MTVEELREALYEWLMESDLTDEELVELYNAATETVGDSDNLIYNMSTFDETIRDQFNLSPSTLIKYLDEEFDLMDYWFTVDLTREEIKSFSDLSYQLLSPFDNDVIVDAIIDTGDSFGFDDIQVLLDQLIEDVSSSTQIDASSNSVEPVRFKLTKPSLRNYYFKGEVKPDTNMFRGTVVKLAPYDDADYWWAKIGWNGADLNAPVEFIYDGKVVETMQLNSYLDEDGEDMYESIDEYMDECIEIVAEKLKLENDKIKPNIVHY